MTKTFILMRKLSLRRVFGLAIAILMAGSLAVSCIFDYETQFSQLEELAASIQGQDAVVSVTPSADGGYVIKFKELGDVAISKGVPGPEGEIKAVTQDSDSFLFVFSNGAVITLPRYFETCVLTFEDADYKGPENTTNYWSAKIDEPQYGGPILYGDGCTWKDEYNTFLSGSVLPYDATTWSGGFSGGGIAISNYGDWLMINVDYTQQLTCFNYDLPDGGSREKAGHNGSNNFAVVYDAGAWGANPATLSFSDGKPRVVESLYVVNTLYTYYVLFYGNDYCSPLAEDGFFKVTATGFDGEIQKGTAEFYLADQGRTFVTKWTKWDLTELGEVDKILFTVFGSAELYGDWGINAPTYFAIDDVTTRVYPE